jgi:hypothetical protein
MLLFGMVSLYRLSRRCYDRVSTVDSAMDGRNLFGNSAFPPVDPAKKVTI